MKRISKKLIVSLLITLSIFNVFLQMKNNYYDVYATEDPPAQTESKGLSDTEKGAFETVGEVADGIIGFITYGKRVTAFLIVYAIKILIGLVALVGGANSSFDPRGIDIQNIIFSGSSEVNGIDIVSVDFFDFSGTGAVHSIRENVAIWYYSLRNVAIVALLIILVYVGIRMVISTVAEEKAKYSKMLTDWVFSLVLLFLMHYIMIFTIEINKVLVDLVAKGLNPGSLLSVSPGGQEIEIIPNVWNSYTTGLAADVFDVKASVGWGALIVYAMMIVVTLIYLIMYIKRMITVAFLIIISPLITITYSIDKMKDGKSQALDTWLKEFIYNILIQPFHCIIYVVFVSTALKLVDDGGIGSVILAIIMVAFMHSAEKIVKNIFGLKSESMADAVSSAAGVMATMKVIQSVGGKGGKSVDPDKIPEMNAPEGGGASTKISNNQNPNNPMNSGASGAGNVQGSTTGQTGNGSEGVSEPHSTSSGSSGDTSEQIPSQAGGYEEGTGGPMSNAEDGNSDRPPITKPKAPEKKKAYQRFLDGANVAINSLPSTTAVTAGVIGLAMGLAMGDFNGVRAGWEAAKSINQGIKGLSNKKKVKQAVERNENSFAAAYQNFRKNHSEMTDAQAKAYTTSLLRGNLDKDISDEDYEYYTYVNGLRNTYAAVGEDDVEGRMMETIDMINSGEIGGEYAGEQNPNAEQQPVNTQENAENNEQNMFKQTVENIKRREDDEQEFEGKRELKNEDVQSKNSYRQDNQDVKDYNTTNQETGKRVWQEKQEQIGNNNAEPPTFEKLGELENDYKEKKEKYLQYGQNLTDYSTINPETGKSVWQEKRKRKNKQGENQEKK